jgi:hypothetical protein
MYQFSRAIYRELAPFVLTEKPGSQAQSNQELVLRGCERAMERLWSDRRHFARPARSLFNDIRTYFSMSSQLRVYFVVKRHVDLVLAFLAAHPEHEYDASGMERSCQAMTRKGQPCQRPPLARSDYCPSHQHLTETFEELEGIDDLEGLELVA